MSRFLVLAAVLLLASPACKKDKPEGLPPAQQWSANANTLPAAPQPNADNNPHGGMGNNPHAGMPGAPADPHAGLDMSGAGGGGGGGGADPHAGMNMNPHGGASAPADPNRKIDPTHRVTGTIKVHPKAKDRVPAGGVIFVIVKQAGPDGAPMGMPLAVEKLTWQKDELKFEVSEANAMAPGTVMAGDVVVTVRYDGDGEGRSKNPGDVEGRMRVKIPAENVTITLDEVL
jgi:hypothetical protein